MRFILSLSIHFPCISAPANCTTTMPRNMHPALSLLPGTCRLPVQTICAALVMFLLETALLVCGWRLQLPPRISTDGWSTQLPPGSRRFPGLECVLIGSLGFTTPVVLIAGISDMRCFSFPSCLPQRLQVDLSLFSLRSFSRVPVWFGPKVFWACFFTADVHATLSVPLPARPY